MEKQYTSRYCQLNFLLKYSSRSYEFNGAKFLKRIKYDPVSRFVRLKKVKDKQTGSVHCNFYFVLSDGTKKTKLFPVIVKNCNGEIKEDIVSGRLYKVDALYTTGFPALAAYDDVPARHAASLIRSLSVHERYDYFEKSKEFIDFLKKYHDILEVLSDINDEVEFEKQFIEVLEDMYITEYSKHISSEDVSPAAEVEPFDLPIKRHKTKKGS